MNDVILKKIYSLLPDNICSSTQKLSLDNILQISKYFDSPHEKFKSIHVAGTNGKGSVTTKIAKALTISGYKTALFTSPHISCYSERIVVDEKKISLEEAYRILKEISAVQKKLNIHLNFFEITTLLSFIYFANEKVDFAVIEVGLGGRYDATNIIKPILSIITSISLDHTGLLGNSLDSIALEKAQIIKSGIPVVIGSKANLMPIVKKAKEEKSPLYIAEKIDGFFDDQNNEIVKMSLDIINKFYKIKENAVKIAILTRPEARFQVFTSLLPGTVIFDAAHNTDGFCELKKAIDQFFPGRKIRVVLGFSKDKDIYGCLKILITFANFVHIINAKYLKSAPTSVISDNFLKLNFKNFKEEKDIPSCINDAKDLAVINNEIILVCGSFYILDLIKKSFKI
ncbi:MAG: Mur ligase family protein [Parachlamydiales bacterium]|jgi:dihydrofolate synthase/folylpolyglutamate synthase